MSGRYLQLRWGNYTELEFEYDRGFARRVEYRRAWYYRDAWQPAATDEPLAYHRPKFSGDQFTTPPSGRSTLTKGLWGDDVYAHAVGFDTETTLVALAPDVDPSMRDVEVKVYDLHAPSMATSTRYHPFTLLDGGALDTSAKRKWAAVATAMTAIAREYVGLAEPMPGG